ncbi:hypothetical protein L1887_57752 [Cichorium endivia]|nr:hypothetical protein L1887_57752 [Cichorium endivia]
MPRHAVVKQLWAYIKSNNLQNESNKRQYILAHAAFHPPLLATARSRWPSSSALTSQRRTSHDTSGPHQLPVSIPPGQDHLAAFESLTCPPTCPRVSSYAEATGSPPAPSRLRRLAPSIRASRRRATVVTHLYELCNPRHVRNLRRAHLAAWMAIA